LDDGIPLVHDWGDRFQGWYLFKKRIRREPISLEHEVTYPINISDYRYQFIMPAVLKFSNGLITYTDADRRFGVFRFPRERDGKFNVPIALSDVKNYMTLTEEQLKALVKNREVLTFKAFSIPQYGFEFFDIETEEFHSMEQICNTLSIAEFQLHYLKELESRTEQVKTKIINGVDYLSILLDVLNLKEKDLEKVSQLTNNVIYRYR